MKHYSKEAVKQIKSLIDISGYEKEMSSHFWYEKEENEGFDIPIIVECFGITNPDSNYHVKRKDRPNFIIEYIVEGEGEVIVNDKKFKVKQGDSYFLFPYTNQEYYADKNHPFKKYWINFHGEVIENVIKAIGIYGVNYYSNTNLENEFLSLFSIDNDNLLAKDIAFSVFPIIMNMILKMEGCHFDKSRYIPQKITQAEQLITQFDNDLTINEVCNELGVSKSYLDREFKKYYKTTMISYKNNKRIDLACAHLINSDLSINEIASKLNFKDMYRFSHMFKKIKGISPLKYRQTHRKY